LTGSAHYRKILDQYANIHRKSDSSEQIFCGSGIQEIGSAGKSSLKNSFVESVDSSGGNNSNFIATNSALNMLATQAERTCTGGNQRDNKFTRDIREVQGIIMSKIHRMNVAKIVLRDDNDEAKWSN
jgi:hypothetical protein